MIAISSLFKGIDLPLYHYSINFELFAFQKGEKALCRSVASGNLQSITRNETKEVKAC